MPKLPPDSKSRNILEFTNAKQKVKVIEMDDKGKQEIVNAEVPVKQLKKIPHNDSGAVWSTEASLSIIANDHYFFQLYKPVKKQKGAIKLSSSWGRLMSKEEVKPMADATFALCLKEFGKIAMMNDVLDKQQVDLNLLESVNLFFTITERLKRRTIQA